MNIDDEWNKFLDNNYNINSNLESESDLEMDSDSNIEPESSSNTEILSEVDKYIIKDNKIPKCSDIYISTKTKIVYLNEKYLDIYKLFWEIKTLDYDKCNEGIIKKQIKISCNTKTEFEKIEELIKNEKYNNSKIINHVDNPNGRVKFKHVRKISVGICKKDLLCRRIKEKSAFYNCFVVTLRILYNNIFKEIHIKIFNTGKLEIPGIQNDDMLNLVINKILFILSNLCNKKFDILKDKTENVLINSNFNCGFYLDREKLFNLLRYKYNINASYDPCSYPGIQSAYYYDTINNKSLNITSKVEKNLKKNKDIQKISYMIFRTGSILIVGKCNENILKIVYEYVKDILLNEYSKIVTLNIENNESKLNKKKNKLRKKIIYVSD